MEPGFEYQTWIKIEEAWDWFSHGEGNNASLCKVLIL